MCFNVHNTTYDTWGQSHSHSCLHVVYVEDESYFEVGIDEWLVLKLCCLYKLDCGQTSRQTNSLIVRKRADGPDYIPLLFPLVPAAPSLICHTSPAVSL